MSLIPLTSFPRELIAASVGEMEHVHIGGVYFAQWYDGCFYEATVLESTKRIIAMRFVDDGYDRVFTKEDLASSTCIVPDVIPEPDDCTVGCTVIAKSGRKRKDIILGVLSEVKSGQRYVIYFPERAIAVVKRRASFRLVKPFLEEDSGDQRTETSANSDLLGENPVNPLDSSIGNIDQPALTPRSPSNVDLMRFPPSPDSGTGKNPATDMEGNVDVGTYENKITRVSVTRQAGVQL